MLSIIGFLTILTIVVLLIGGRITPIMGLVLVPVGGALLAGFNIVDIGGFFNEGIDSVISVVIMFIFAILFFGIMQDTGLFDPLINKMIALTKGSVVAVAVGTVIVGAVAHLDGSGASTFLITIPALLPLYLKLRMSPYLLLLLVGLSASIMNLVPWAGPIGRAGAVLGVDPSALWRPLIPVQISAMLLLIVLAAFLGIREKRRISRMSDDEVAKADAEAEVAATSETAEPAVVERDPALARPKLLWLNLLISLAVITVLVWDILPSGLVFMLGLSIALPINYPKVNDQMERIKTHAPNALMMAAIILAAGSFLGIMNGTGMLDSLATDLVMILPAFVVPYLHVIMGVFGVPFDLVLSTDAYYFALLPVVEQIVTSHGVDSITAAYTMIIGNIIGTFVSPFSPALWLALGLAGLEMGKHIRYSFFWVWGFSIVLLIVAFLIGVI
ncbi:CitMHS family transporter [Alteribacter keqinensis]|uniref:Citrate transporter n=1 Tax=Alteribacter keqinensis TaxID=2483800 RepID=A0A3M7TN56_9BACI|nr:citrate:proton symporter [Alteribacter keqinensis]RNA67063.1 citrate transporter [Alteribacter keqinensis]